MRLPWMTTRRWMVAVAAVAIVVAGALEVRRLQNLRRVYLGVAEDYESNSRTLRRDNVRSHGDLHVRSHGDILLIKGIAGERPASLQSREGKAKMDRIAKGAAYCDQLRAKYERAARYPWLPVEPDPPGPQ